ncbi:hypothetical protein K2173_024172 [Erythroxylum novogranatense]|uniref:WRC domain-containing protein n=1 Tax=Erythroxylum novogranatense TaxID=1862640 RepID=A0AAV8UH51_9ROSI|nr:hypothetical protein K2173_024172 [Erythroxylum novogranatense]
MRIRKRQVPLPLSSLSPVPLSSSDPLSSFTSSVQLMNPPLDFSSQPHKASSFVSHQLNPRIRGETSNDVKQVPCHPAVAENDVKGFQVMVEWDNERGEAEDERRNDISKGSSWGADVGNSVSQLNSSRQILRWYEVEKVFPLKKRRGSFERRGNEVEKNKKMATKMNKKCEEQYGREEGQQRDEKEIRERISGCSSGNGKKSSRGGALMEGSRCSRVNGRGWRCCQQTLVGYSLCEHHLGKGRLRSMNSVRNRSFANTAPKKMKSSQPLSSPSLPLEEKEMNPAFLGSKTASEVEDEDDKKPLMTSKTKKMKLGTVKARSISSLLGKVD